MRFGRNSKNWAAVGRRFLGERMEGSAAVASEERHALLGPDPDATGKETENEMEATASIPEEESAMSADPTQLLLTALGRFQRQVAKAESGASHRDWTDECMEQLISAIEIAVDAGWQDIQRALTDTARVLQTFEDAGIADESVPFLQDSYEILCLMVGDLIVDNVRSGVMQKWEQRYARAVEDLRQLGLSPVEDDGVMRENDADDTSAAAPTVDESAAPVTEEADDTDADDNLPESLLEPDDTDAPSFDAPAFEVFAEPEEAEADFDAAWQPEPDADAEMDAEAEDETRDAPEPEEETADRIVPFASRNAMTPEIEEDEDAEAVAESDASPFALPDESEFETPETDDGRADALLIDDTVDVQAEVIELPDEAPEEELVYEALEEAVAEPETPAESEDTIDAEAESEVTAPSEPLLFDFGVNEEIAQEGEEEIAPVDAVELTELGDGSDAVVDSDTVEEVEAADTVETALEAKTEEPIADVPEAALATDAETESDTNGTAEEIDTADIAEEPAPVAEAPAEDALFEPAPPAASPSESLLHTAQAAMARGDLADAKLIALRLAADMARQEAQRAAEALAEAEARRDATLDAIANAEQQVADAEFGVESQQRARAQREQDLDRRRESNAGLQVEIKDIERGIADLEEQIRALQAQRDDEAARLAAVNQDFTEGETEAAAIATDIEALQQLENDAAEMLDAARARVSSLVEEKGGRESDIARAKALVTRQEESVADIERTITHVMPEPPAAETE